MKDMFCSTVDDPSPPGVNEGWAMAHPLESAYAQERRRLIANPAMSQSTLRQYQESARSAGRAGGLDVVLADMLQDEAIRQCPVCATKLFHPSIYQLTCLKLCPFHHQPLVKACPSCGKAWACPSSRSKILCETCESVSWGDCGKTQLKRSTLRQLQKVDRWLAEAVRVSNQPASFWIQDQRLRTSWVSSAESPRFQLPNHRHGYFAAFEDSRSDGRLRRILEKLHIPSVHAPLKTRTTDLISWHGDDSIEPWDEYIDDVQPQVPLKSRSMIGLALKRIFEWQKGHFGDCHRFVWRDLRQLRLLEDRLTFQAACPLCMTFSLWCQAITMKYTNLGSCSTPGDHELFRLLRYASFPVTAEALFFAIPNQGLFCPSNAFELWFYLRSTDYLFLELFLLVRWFRRCLNEITPSSSGGVFDGRYQFRMPDVGSQLMDFVLTPEGKMSVSYLYETPLEELVPSEEERGLIEACNHCREDGPPIVWGGQAGSARLEWNALNEFLGFAVPRFHRAQGSSRWIPHQILRPFEWQEPGTSAAVVKVDDNNHPRCFHPASFTN